MKTPKFIAVAFAFAMLCTLFTSHISQASTGPCCGLPIAVNNLPYAVCFDVICANGVRFGPIFVAGNGGSACINCPGGVASIEMLTDPASVPPALPCVLQSPRNIIPAGSPAAGLGSTYGLPSSVIVNAFLITFQ